MNIRFGKAQRSNPTPASVSNRIDFTCGALGLISMWLTTAQYIPTMFSDIFSSISTGLIIPILLLTKKYWGVETDRKRISIDEVGEIKEKDQPK